MPERQRRATVSIGFPVAAEQVWVALTDFPRMHGWFVGVRQVRIVEGGAPRVGAHRSVRFLGGHRATELITWWEPPTLAVRGATGVARSDSRGGVQGSFRLRLRDGTRLAASTDIDVAVRGTPLRSRVRWQIAYQPRYGVYGQALGWALATPLLRSAVGVSLRRLRRRLRRGRRRAQPVAAV